MRRHPLLFVCGAFAAAALLLAGATVLAVHDEDMELEGNILGADAPDPPAVDWANLFTAGSFATPPASVGQVLVPGGGTFGVGTFVRDFVPGGTSDDMAFATGSKDTLNPTPDWQCKGVNNFGPSPFRAPGDAIPVTRRR